MLLSENKKGGLSLLIITKRDYGAFYYSPSSLPQPQLQHAQADGEQVPVSSTSSSVFVFISSSFFIILTPHYLYT